MRQISRWLYDSFQDFIPKWTSGPIFRPRKGVIWLIRLPLAVVLASTVTKTLTIICQFVWKDRKRIHDPVEPLSGIFDNQNLEYLDLKYEVILIRRRY